MAIRVFFLPSQTLNNLKQMPEKSGVYYMTALWQLLYVGKAINLRKRLTSGHQRYRQLKILVPFARIHYKILPKTKISFYEINEIKNLKPCWNYTAVPKFWGLLGLFLGFWLRFWVFVAVAALAIRAVVYLFGAKIPLKP